MEGMERRILIAILLSVLVLVLYPLLFPPPTPPPPPPDEKVVEAPVQKEKGEMAPRATEIIEVSGESEEKTITVETALYKATFTNKGGVIRHWELKQYWVDLEKENNIVLFDPGEVVIEAYPMTVSTADSELNRFVKNGLFSIEGDDIHLSAGNPEGHLNFTIIDPQTGKGFKKSFTFYNDTYRVDVEITPVNIGTAYTVSTGSNFGISEWGEAKIVGFVGPVTQVGTKIKKDKVGKIEDAAYHEGDIKWTAIQDKYFISALIPAKKVDRAIIRKSAEKDVQAEIEFPEGEKGAFVLYAGPKEYERLKSFGVGLDSSISFGWFIVWELSIISYMAKGLFYLLHLFYKLSHNYGVAIILLTMVVRVVFIPLTFKSFKSMKEMQKLQPEIQKLQKKYKDNRTEMNKAMMGLYKTHKVNPLGGCLPMVLQLPVFIGLFNLLANTIELRHTPFILWINDLSVKDPYYVLPIIMGITMLLQQKMTPSTMDPTQAKIMLVMPVIFTFFFLNFPAGLVLYWLVNNILTIGQQYVTMKYFHK